MMYCINCGVRLSDSETKCPLCKTTVYHPDIEVGKGKPLYPDNKFPGAEKSTKLPQMIFTILLLFPILSVLIADFNMNKTITWSGYVVGATVMGYIIVVLPLWFKRPSPAIFVPCGFAAIGLYLLYIDLATNGDWFLTFAFPTVVGVGIIVTTVSVLLRYVKRGKLYIFGGAFIALGAFLLLMEFLSSYTFENINFIGWSLYPLTAFIIVGALLIFLAICRPARESMERKFFI